MQYIVHKKTEAVSFEEAKTWSSTTFRRKVITDIEDYAKKGKINISLCLSSIERLKWSNRCQILLSEAVPFEQLNKPSRNLLRPSEEKLLTNIHDYDENKYFLVFEFCKKIELIC